MKLFFALMGATSLHASAVVIVDSFSDASGTSTTLSFSGAPTGGLPESTSATGGTTTPLSGVIGGVRRQTLTREAVAGSANRAVATAITDGTPNSSFFEYTSGNGGDGQVQLQYGSSAPLNLGLAADETILRINFEAFDAPAANATLPVSISIEAAGVIFSDSGFVPETSALAPNFLLDFDLEALGLTTAQLADVDQINVSFDPGFGGDFDVVGMRLVPEPSSALLSLMVVPVLLRRKRVESRR